MDLVTGKPVEGIDVHAMQWPEDFDQKSLVGLIFDGHTMPQLYVLCCPWL